MSLDNGRDELMAKLDDCTWASERVSTESTDGSHVITVTAQSLDGRTATDTINVYSNQQSRYHVPFRHAIDYENALGAWTEKHILDTQLGPNETSRQKREHATQ